MKYIIGMIIGAIAVLIGFLKRKKKQKTKLGATLEKTIPDNDDDKRANLSKYGNECAPPD